MDMKLLDVEQDPEFKKASERLRQLGERRSNFQRRKDELLALLLLPDNPKDRAERLLVDDPQQDLRPDKSVMREELGTCDREIEVTDAAMKLIQERLGNLRRQVSAKICEDLKPEYRKIVGRMLHALRELAAVNQQEIEFIDQLARHDITIYLERCVFSQFGTLGDSQSMVSIRIRQIEQDYPELRRLKVA